MRTRIIANCIISDKETNLSDGRYKHVHMLDVDHDFQTRINYSLLVYSGKGGVQ